MIIELQDTADRMISLAVELDNGELPEVWTREAIDAGRAIVEATKRMDRLMTDMRRALASQPRAPTEDHPFLSKAQLGIVS
jgi:hypothetical protein